MPRTREDHIHYTRHEFLSNTIPYYIDLVNFLKNSKLKSYLDIGANIGEYCNIVSELVPSIEQYYLIEPHPENIKFLRNNINKNIVNKCNIFESAVSYNEQQFIYLINDPYFNVGGYMTRNEGDIKVACNKIEQLNIPIVDLAKIDVEGAEYDILKNSSYLKKVKYLEIEFHGPDKALNFEDPKLFLTSHLSNFSVLFHNENFDRVLLENTL